MSSPWIAALAARHTDDALRAASSSGGVFSALALDVLARGGAVFGAAWTDHFVLRHRVAESPADLAALRGSKYVRSDTADTYAQAAALLAAGRPVLYCGSPCEIAALKKHLGSDPDGLLCVDFVCHGTPPPEVFATYVRHLERQHGAMLTGFSFRDKQRGWRDFCVAATFANGDTYAAGQTEDPYMIGFLRNLCLRACCYHCPYKGESRAGDLRLADLWGAWETLPDWDDDKGLSLVLVGSEKGAAALSAVTGRLRTTPVELTAYRRHNGCIFSPVPLPPERDAFMRHIAMRGFDGVEKAFYAPPSIIKRAVAKARRVMKRFARRG